MGVSHPEVNQNWRSCCRQPSQHGEITETEGQQVNYRGHRELRKVVRLIGTVLYPLFRAAFAVPSTLTPPLRA